MKKQDDEMSKGSDELHDHYDLDYRKAKPNRFAERLSQESVMVVLEPDITVTFLPPASINNVLNILRANRQCTCLN